VVTKDRLFQWTYPTLPRYHSRFGLITSRDEPAFQQRHVLPGFGLSLGFTLLYLSIVVLIPLSTLFLKTATLSWAGFMHEVLSPRVLASYRLTFGASLIGAALNGFFGLIVAWVLVRYTFPSHRLVDALIDLPFALPTAVAGIALTTLYAPQGWIGRYLTRWGIRVALRRSVWPSRSRLSACRLSCARCSR